jgi:hypothetical protein
MVKEIDRNVNYYKYAYVWERRFRFCCEYVNKHEWIDQKKELSIGGRTILTTYLREIHSEDADCIHLAQERDLAPANTIIKLMLP